MIDRIFKNWKTTAIGVALLVMSWYALAFTEATLTEVSAFMVAGFGLFFLKDGKGS